MNTKTRLEQEAALMAKLDERRRETGDDNLGSSIEREILERELKALEADILEDPGALQPMLVPVRMRFNGRLI